MTQKKPNTKVGKKYGRKTLELREKIDATKNYNLEEAIELVQAGSTTKFDQTLDLALNLGVDPKHSDQMVRGVINLPNGTGKNVRVAVICREDRMPEAEQADADFYNSQDIINNVKTGKINFDVCIATPDMMGVVGQLARILGPKGLMPNPKLGTVTTDIATAVKNAKTGQVEFRAEKNGIIHAGVGKLSFSKGSLAENVKSLVSAVIKARPSGAKGTYLKKAYISPTMGPSIKLNIAELNT